MGHTYLSHMLHIIFSVKERRRLLTKETRERLFAYMIGIARKNDMKILAVGGVEDHVHLLVSMPSSISLAEAAQRIKGVSSRWIHETFPALQGFAWQEGYAAFSVSLSRMDRTVKYILGQEEHHKKVSFQEEFIAFLKAHKIEYDERYVWG